jgi:UTP--glucose-1-phosphate uridylyltransferase
VKVRKAVVLAAGYGTRLLPATKAQPKEALPLVDKPIIQYVIEEAVASGLEDIVIVTAYGKRAIEDHFDRSLELEAHLERKGDLKRLEDLRRLSDMANFVYVRQTEQKGVGHAVLTARPAVGDEPFALFFPDDVMVGSRPAAAQLLDVFEDLGGSCLAVEQVADADVSSYGIAAGDEVRPGVTKVSELVEKPKPEDTPSRLGIIGRYVITPGIFAELERTQPGAGGEIQLTDGLAALLAREPVYACQVHSERYDTGRPFGLLRASIELGLRDPEVGPQLRQYLKQRAADL